jgi:estrone sulfotransferase
VARLPLVWLRNLRVRPTDTFIASYPRSGNTWARFLVCEILTDNEAGFESADSTVPYVHLRNKLPSVLQNGGRLLKTHERFRTLYKRAIYFVRDPRDVVISNYDFESAHQHGRSLGEFVESSVRGKVNAWGQWHKHVMSWLDSPLADSDDFLLIRYEDMRRDAERELSRMAAFLGLPVDPIRIRQAIANNTVPRMHQKEDQHFGRSPEEGVGYKSGRRVHIGSVGRWQQRLSAAQVRLIEDQAGDLMERLGYQRQHELGTVVREARAGQLSSVAPPERDSRLA